MSYPSPETINYSNGIHELFIYLDSVTNSMFSNMLLFSIFMILALASYFVEKRLQGEGNLLDSIMTGAFITLIITFVLSLMDGFLNTYQVLFILTANVVLIIIFLAQKT